MYSQILTLIVLIVLSAIFSGSETALVSLTKAKVDELVEKKARNSKILKKLKSDPHKLLITILIGNNIVNIGASAYAAVLFIDLFGSNAIGIATGVMTFLILVFGEITPKSFAHSHSEGVSLFMARPIYYLQVMLFPLVWVFDKIVEFTNYVFGSESKYSVTEGEIVAMLKIGAQEGSIQKQRGILKTLHRSMIRLIAFQLFGILILVNGVLKSGNGESSFLNLEERCGRYI